MRKIFWVLSLAFSANTIAQTSDPEWPCIQVLVPEIVTAVMWPEEITDEQLDAWRKDPSLSSIVEEFSNLDQFTEIEQQRVEAFVESVPEASRLATLNTVAQGIVDTANQRRDRYINGIKRYTRQQISIADQIGSTLNELAALDQGGTTVSPERRTEIEETLAWHQRVYDQREQAIGALCDVPVELEEKLSSVVRELAQYLP